MIISCIKCNKKFDIDDGLIPEKGRLLECSSCNHRWFFKDVISNNVVKNELSNTTNILHSPSIEEKDDISIKGDLVDEEILINKEPEIQIYETNNDMEARPQLKLFRYLKCDISIISAESDDDITNNLGRKTYLIKCP